MHNRLQREIRWKKKKEEKQTNRSWEWKHKTNLKIFGQERIWEKDNNAAKCSYEHRRMQ
jgi:hypothetical protein